MSGIGNVPDIANFVTQMLKVAIDQVKGQKGPAVAQMNIVVHRRPADIHADKFWNERGKSLFDFAQRIVNKQIAMLRFRQLHEGLKRGV
jgi:hypothetical protein